MRKLKKINGYLVVRFNDREKREYKGTGLGNFGVIDAELYTGILDVDRSVMEYDDAETLEIALEQARGLESELDVVEPEVKITVIIEGETEVSEEDVEPERLFKERRAILEAQLKNGPHLDLAPLTAAHELHGYAKALEDLGMIDGHDERFLVERDTFGATAPPPDQQEEALAYINGGPATPGSSARWLEVKLLERITPETLQQIMNAAQSGESRRETFENVPSGMRNDYNTKKIYALGLALAGVCPKNDCKIYLNIFNMARDLDAALDMFRENTASALALRSALMDRLGDLWEMYSKNHAVQQYKEGIKK